MDTSIHLPSSCSDAQPMMLGSGQVQQEAVTHLVDNAPPYSCLSQAPSRMLCSSPPALISTAALLPSSPAAQPMGIAVCPEQWRSGADDPPAATTAATPLAPLAAAAPISTGCQVQQPATAETAPDACPADTDAAENRQPAAVPEPMHSRGRAPSMPALPLRPVVPASGTSCNTSKGSSGTPNAAGTPGSTLPANEPATPTTPAGGGRDPLDEVAALHAQFLTPKHLRKGKGGRQPALDPRRDPSVDPARAKRVLANRLSAARSKMKARSQAQVVEARLEQVQQQRQSMQAELQSLSSSFHATTQDNQNLHRQLQALEQHRSQQDALHKQLQTQRDRLVAAGSSLLTLPEQTNSAATLTALDVSMTRPAPMQTPAHPDSRMHALLSLPSAILTASGVGYPVREAAGALRGSLRGSTPADQQEQPLPWPPSVLPCNAVQQDSLPSHSGVDHSGRQQLLPALPPLLLPFPTVEGFGGGGHAEVCQPVSGIGWLGDTGHPRAAGVSSLDTCDIVPQLLQHGSYAHFKEQEHLGTSSVSSTVAWSPYQAWE